MYLVLSLILILLCTPVHANTRDGLQGFWMLDDTGATAIDSSWKANNGTLTGTTIVSNCARGGCKSFNGSSDYIQVASSGLVTNGAAWTISAWVLTTSTTAGHIYREASTASATPVTGLTILVTSGFASINIRDDASVVATLDSSVSVIDGKWHHVVGVQATKSSRTLYVDGVSVATNSTTVGAFTFNNSTIGALHRTPASADLFLTGQVDDVRVYNRAITAQEVLDLYNSGIKIQGTATKLNY